MQFFLSWSVGIKHSLSHTHPIIIDNFDYYFNLMKINRFDAIELDKGKMGQ